MSKELSRLEMAMLDMSGIQLDLYLEGTSTQDIMRDIEAIRRKAALSTPAGELRERIMQLLTEPT